MKRVTEQTLGEQMGVGPREIARRLHMFDIVAEDQACLRRAAPGVARAISDILERFYALQLADSEIAVIIGDSDTLSRIKLSTRGYILSLFSGSYDVGYAEGRLRVGKVHRRLGVTPRLYMNGLRNLQSVLDAAVEAACREDSSLGEAAKIQASLHKVLFFDAQLIFEAYMATHLIEIESAKEEVDEYAAKLNIKFDIASPRLRDLSNKDSLTGLLNRRAASDYLEHEIDVAKRHRLPICLAYMDLNRFKRVNDTEGHAAGDEVLVALAGALRATTRAADIVGRFGGDEFCVIMPRTTLPDTRKVLERLVREFDARNPRDVTLSVGVARIGPTEFLDPEKFVGQADQLMYIAKSLAHAQPGHHFRFQDGEIATLARAADADPKSSPA